MRSLLLDLKNPTYAKVLKELLEPFFQLEPMGKATHIADIMLMDTIDRGSFPARTIVYIGPDLTTSLKPYMTALKQPVRLQTLLDALDANHTLLIGSCIFHPSLRFIRHGFKEIEVMLTEKEADLLLALWEARGPLHRGALLKNVWGYALETDSHALETNIYRLRQKISALHSFSLEARGDGYELLVKQVHEEK